MESIHTEVRPWKDPYFVTKEKLTADVSGLLTGKYDIRPLELIPAVLKNETFDVMAIAEEAVRRGVQNQLLYLFRVTRILASEFDDNIDLDDAIEYLDQNRNREEKWLGGGDFLEFLDQKEIYEKICREAQTELMRECRAFGNYKEDTFRRQYDLYRDGPAVV